jgi:hypothetical protein
MELENIVNMQDKKEEKIILDKVIRNNCEGKNNKTCMEQNKTFF